MSRELLHVWEQTGKTVIFVTHSIEEAVSLSDRVLVLSPRPAVIRTEEAIDLPRPRERTSAAFQEVTGRLREMLV
jgi:NitT/TauT family transport system ATP-binding protein